MVKNLIMKFYCFLLQLYLFIYNAYTIKSFIKSISNKYKLALRSLAIIFCLFIKILKGSKRY